MNLEDLKDYSSYFNWGWNSRIIYGYNLKLVQGLIDLDLDFQKDFYHLSFSEIEKRKIDFWKGYFWKGYLKKGSKKDI